MRILTTSLALLGAAWLLSPSLSAGPTQAASSATASCVDLGTPKPTLSYVHRYTSTQGSTEYTNKWVLINATGSHLITTQSASGAASTYVSQHRVVDDVFVLDGSTATGADANGPFKNSMAYKPGALGDPAFRACTGKTWTVPSVTATSNSLQGSFSTKTGAGTLAIVAIHESVTVPAGTFDTVRYVKTMGPVRDEFWKSIEHGVTVKRTSVQPGAVGTEILIAIK